MSIRVAIVEDDRAVRENLAVLIDAAPGFACVAVCASGEEALKRLPQAAPDVVLMDIHLPGRSGINCVARLRPVLRQTYVIMLTVKRPEGRAPLVAAGRAVFSAGSIAAFRLNEAGRPA